MSGAQNEIKCEWCFESFVGGRRGAHIKRFCSTECKTAYHTAARRFGEKCLSDGRVTVSELRALSPPRTTKEQPDSNVSDKSLVDANEATYTTDDGEGPLPFHFEDQQHDCD